MDIEALQNTPGHIGPLEIAPRARNEPIENLVQQNPAKCICTAFVVVGRKRI